MRGFFQWFGLLVSILVLLVGNNLILQIFGKSIFELIGLQIAGVVMEDELAPAPGAVATVNPTAPDERAPAIPTLKSGISNTPQLSTPDLSMGPNQHGYSSGSDSSSSDINAASQNQKSKASTYYKGNIISCAPQDTGWIWLYRLDGNYEWEKIGKGIGSIEASGYIKIDGVPVNVSRFGKRGEPYKIEQVIDGRVENSTGDFKKGEPEFRVYPNQDNHTSWNCVLN